VCVVNTQWHNLLADIRDKRSLIFYDDTEFVSCARNVRSWLAWFKVGTWKPGRVR
jgi:hypothetical protein